MKRSVVAMTGLALLSGCAFPNAVHRMGVDYNTAVADMTNELTLLNIVRAKEQLPLHYTSLGRLNGNLTIKGSASFGDEIRGSEITKTTSASPSSVDKTGVDTLKPTVGGEVSTGSNFDVAILDTQKFYQGITAAIPFTTVENYLAQGFSNELMARLVIERIDFKAGAGANEGQLLFSWENAPSGTKAAAFAKNMACYELLGRGERKPIDIAPISRLSAGPDGKAPLLTIEQLALVDGKNFELSDSLTTDAGDDSKIFLRRVGGEKRKADLRIRRTCPNRAISDAEIPDDVRDDKKTAKPDLVSAIDPSTLPERPPGVPLYLGSDKAMVLSADRKSDTETAVKIEIVFRSPESVIQYIGRYLRAEPKDRYRLGDHRLFVLGDGRDATDLVRVKLLDRQYGITRVEQPRNSMIVLGFIEQLINLHKESSDRPVTVPVQVIGGS